MGDVFILLNDDTVQWLCTDAGTLSKVATNLSEFEHFLLDDDNIDNWFLPSLIEDLMNAVKLLQSNQVYSFKKLPVIGGDYSVDNLEPTDLSVHLEFIGLIHQQIKDLPDGTPVRIKLFD